MPEVFNLSILSGNYENCHFEYGVYSNEHTAVQIYSGGECVATITCNFPDAIKGHLKSYSCVDTNNCPWAEEIIVQQGIGQPTGLYVWTGSPVAWPYPIYKFYGMPEIESRLVEKFKNNELWILIKPENYDLINVFHERYPELNFSDESPFTEENVAYHAGRCTIWVRYEKGIRYTKLNPRINGARALSPEIYDHGKIIRLENLLGIPVTETAAAENVNITEEEVLSLFT